MLQTKRLRLRQWTNDDFLPFSNMCRDQDVMAHFPKLLTQDESVEMAKKITSFINERGWGLWAVEIPGQQEFIGFVGLHIPKDTMPFSPCVEIGWRLAKPYWGKGYATEAAKKVLEYAFTMLNLNEVVSFTTLANEGSKAVMKKIGMCDTKQNFMHPAIDPSHPQCEHVLYKINKTMWQEMR